MTFTPIETQEAFDNAIKERLERERTTLTKKFEGYISPEELAKQKEELNSKITALNASIQESSTKYANYDKELAARDAKIKKYESDSVKTRIANEYGLPFEIASRLNGDSEEDIRQDAESLSKLISKKTIAPLANHEEQKGDNLNEAFLRMAQSLKKGD